MFVKSGGESFLLGATTAENKTIMANDVALIVVSYLGNCDTCIQYPGGVFRVSPRVCFLQIRLRVGALQSI